MAKGEEVAETVKAQRGSERTLEGMLVIRRVSSEREEKREKGLYEGA